MNKTHITNITAESIKIENWRVDDDGFLRVTMCILREGVFTYSEKEIDDAHGDPNKKVSVYIPLTQFSDPAAMATLEGKPLVRDSHDWREAATAAKDKKTIGAMAGIATIRDGGLYIDGTIFDLQTSTDIQSGKLVDVSAGYTSAVQHSSGDFNGAHYDYVQHGD